MKQFCRKRIHFAAGAAAACLLALGFAQGQGTPAAPAPADQNSTPSQATSKDAGQNSQPAVPEKGDLAATIANQQDKAPAPEQNPAADSTKENVAKTDSAGKQEEAQSANVAKDGEATVTKSDPQSGTANAGKQEIPEGGKAPSKGLGTAAPRSKSAARVTPPKRHARHIPPTPGKPKKVVVREGGAEEPVVKILTDLPPEEAKRQREDSENWLSSTDTRLKQLSARSLDAGQAETVAQIEHYVQGARSALKEGDLSRAHTLALKANLLAEDLATH